MRDRKGESNDRNSARPQTDRRPDSVATESVPTSPETPAMKQSEEAVAVPGVASEATAAPGQPRRMPERADGSPDNGAEKITIPEKPGPEGLMIPEKPAPEGLPASETGVRPNIAPADTGAARAPDDRGMQAKLPGAAQPAPAAEMARVLEDRGHRDRGLDAARARRIDDREDATALLHSILGQAEVNPSGPNQAHSGAGEGGNAHRAHQGRLPAHQVGRSEAERESAVGYMIRRFAGGATVAEAPPEFHSRGPGREHADPGPRSGGVGVSVGVGGGTGVGADHRDRAYNGPDQPHFHGPSQNRRVVYYSSRSEVPPVLLASIYLNRVEAEPLMQSAYRPGVEGVDPGYYQNIPENYRSQDAYAVSYPVDPESAVSRGDIVFQQGSTAFADSYSYDLVVDLAEAMTAPALQGEKFIVEGHASAEGDYGSNLRLSQERAERIARDLVDMGVNPDRLVPVGYGEAEARYPATSAEPLRSADRRVVVFRMAETTQ